MDDSTASGPVAFERLHLDLRGTRFTIERDDLLNLPESVLLCLFPNGLALNNNIGHNRHLGYSSADEDEDDEEDEDVYIVDFDPACLSYVLAFFKAAQDAFYGTELQPGKFRGGILAANRLSAYLQSQNAAASAEFGIDYGPQSGWANQNPLLTKQAVIVLREELEYFAIPPRKAGAAAAASADESAASSVLAKAVTGGNDDMEHVLGSDALARLKRDAGRALLERRQISPAHSPADQSLHPKFPPRSDPHEPPRPSHPPPHHSLHSLQSHPLCPLPPAQSHPHRPTSIYAPVCAKTGAVSVPC